MGAQLWRGYAAGDQSGATYFNSYAKGVLGPLPPSSFFLTNNNQMVRSMLQIDTFKYRIVNRERNHKREWGSACVHVNCRDLRPVCCSCTCLQSLSIQGLVVSLQRTTNSCHFACDVRLYYHPVDFHEIHAGLRGIQGRCDTLEHGHDDIPLVECEDGFIPAGKKLLFVWCAMPPPKCRKKSRRCELVRLVFVLGLLIWSVHPASYALLVS